MSRRVQYGLSMLLVASLAGGVLYSQETEENKASGRRLPNHYPQVGLRQSQREQIYAIQDRYAEQIEDLIRQVEALRKQRDAEIEKVLDAPQRAELARLVAEAAARSKAKKATLKAEEKSAQPANKSPE